LAKVDSSTNEIEGVDLKPHGRPLIMLYPAYDKQNPQTFDGRTNVQGMAEWLSTRTRNTNWEQDL